MKCGDCEYFGEEYIRVIHRCDYPESGFRYVMSDTEAPEECYSEVLVEVI